MVSPKSGISGKIPGKLIAEFMFHEGLNANGTKAFVASDG